MTVDKTSALRSLLIRAWRERWTDIQWSIRLKDILPRGCCGDVYDLTGLILAQALNATVPNALLLSYFNHCLASRVVSHSAVLGSVSTFDDILAKRPHCVAALLDIIDSCRRDVTARGEPEMCLSLATSLLKVNSWLLKVIHSALASTGGDVTDVEVSNCMKAVTLVQSFLDDEFSLSMLFIGKLEEKETYYKMVSGLKRITADHLKAGYPSVVPNPVQLKRDLTRIATSICMDPVLLDPAAVGLMERQPTVLVPKISSFLHVVQPLLMYEAVLAPTSDLDHLSLRIHTLSVMHNVSYSDLVYEIIRSLLLSISQDGCLDSLKVDNFILIKLPVLLEKLLDHAKASTVLKTPTDTYKAFDKIIKNESLLDTLDCRCRCNIVHMLVQVIGKSSVQLLTDTERDDILKRRVATDKTFPESLIGPTRQFDNSVKAESGVITSMLRTLDIDLSGPDSIENLLDVLCDIISGDSLNLLLAASAANGKLKSFVKTIIRFNQHSQESQGESIKNSLLRGALFDITFLMLVHVVQCFGSEAVLVESQGTFIHCWISDLVVESNGKVKPFQHGAMPDNLLQQLQNGELRTQVVKWQNICGNVHVAMRDVLVARWQNLMTKDKYDRIVGTLCSKLCALPVCVVAWLANCRCSVPGSLDVPGIARDFVASATASAASSEMPHAKERLALMTVIANKMLAQSELAVPDLAYESGAEALVRLWDELLVTNRLSFETVWKLKSLHDAGGSDWFVGILLDQLLNIVYKSKLDKSADFLVALFHIDIETCTRSLLHNLVTSYVRCYKKRERLTDPHGSAVAKLLITCVCSSLASSQSNCDEPRQPKAVRLEPDVVQELATFFTLLETILTSQESPVSPVTHFAYRLLEQSALMSGLVMPSSKGQKSPVRVFLHHVSADLILHLVRVVPDLFDSLAIIPKLFDVTGQAGRRNAARVLCQLKNKRGR